MSEKSEGDSVGAVMYGPKKVYDIFNDTMEDNPMDKSHDGQNYRREVVASGPEGDYVRLIPKAPPTPLAGYPVPSAEYALAEKQTQALTTLATSFNAIAEFITGPGLVKLLQEQAQSQAITNILGGLAAHDGRNSLDARTMGQNALEIGTLIMQTVGKCQDMFKEGPREVVKAEEAPPTQYLKNGKPVGPDGELVPE